MKITVMNLKYGQLNVLEQTLETLPPLYKIAFAAACCERLIPHYEIFLRKIQEQDWNGENSLRVALEEIWQFLAGKKIDAVRFHQLYLNCKKNYPEDYENEETPEAQRAADAIFKTLKLCLEPTSQQAIAMAAEVQETLFEYIDYLMCQSEGAKWEKVSHQQLMESVANHPFTVREMAKQSEDLQRLHEMPTLTPEFLEWLRTSSYNGGKSLLDLS